LSTPLVTPRVLAVFAIFAAVAVLYWPAMVALGELWRDGARTTYTHGFLVAAISLWLVWRDRASFTGPDVPGLTSAQRVLATVALLVAALCWQAAYRAGLQLAVEVLMLPLFWLPVALLAGRNAARATFLPVALLIFTLPLWDVLTPILQYATVHAAQLMLRLVGVPVFFHGNTVEIPEGEFLVEGGCSGLHYFITALFVATLLGELRLDHWKRRLWWLCLAGGLAVAVNWFRVASIIYIGHVSDMRSYLVTESHYGYGWTLFAIALGLLFWIERRTPHSEQAASLQPALDARPVAPARVSPAWYAACVFVVALPVMLNAIVSARVDAGVSMVHPFAPRAGWIEANPAFPEWQPVQNNADAESRRRFELDSFAIESYVAEYREQRLGKKLGGYANRPQGEAEILDSGTLGNPHLAWMLLQWDGRRSMLVFTYRVGDREFSNATRAQLWYAWQSLRSLSSPRSEMRSWYARCNPDCDHARSRLVQFLAEEGSH
ncbi:MAG: exosortase, partial [Peristeroidobacter soli]